MWKLCVLGLVAVIGCHHPSKRPALPLEDAGTRDEPDVAPTADVPGETDADVPQDTDAEQVMQPSPSGSNGTYTDVGFKTFYQHPASKNLTTNWWNYGERLIVRDMSGGEIVVPVASADGNAYLLVSKDRGRTFTFLRRSGGGVDPLANHMLLAMRQDSAGRYHLLTSATGNVYYSRFVLNRDGSKAVTSYSHQVSALGLFGGDVAIEHVAGLTLALDQSGAECIVVIAQGGSATKMQLHAQKTSTVTPSSAGDFHKLDGTSGYETLMTGTTNSHEHVAFVGFVPSSKDLYFVWSHGTAEGYKNSSYGDVAAFGRANYLRCRPDGPHSWAIGSWAHYEHPSGQGIHVRTIAESNDAVYLVVGSQDKSGAQSGDYSIDRIAGSKYTHQIVPNPPGPTYNANDAALTVSEDGATLLLYIASFGSDPASAQHWYHFEGSKWTQDKCDGAAASWQSYGVAGSTGDRDGLYVVRADGTYGATRPAIGAYYRN